MSARRLGIASVSSAACCSLLFASLAAPSSAAQVRAADPAPVLSTKSALPNPWAQEAGNGLAFAGKARSEVRSQGSSMEVTLRGVKQAVRTKTAGGSSGMKRSGIVKAWKALRGTGDHPLKGVVAGKTSSGENVAIPVLFEPGIRRKGDAFTVMAQAAGGALDEKVTEAFSALGSVEPKAVGARFRYLSVYAVDGDSRAWRFTTAAPSGTLTSDQNGAVRVRINKPGRRGAGVQMGQTAASLPWDYLHKQWQDVAENGVQPTVLITGIGRNGRARAVTLRPESMTHGRNLVFEGKVLAGLTEAQARSLRAMRGVSATLITSNAAHDTRYVVITGDSISSGESGRYMADFEAADWNGLLAIQQLDKFCKSADLACTDAQMTGDLSADYHQDLTRAYEKGTQKAGECHRSYSAPGTWLSRYYAIEQGEKVEAINIACSGATTDAMTHRFNHQEPQAKQLRHITDFLYVPYVTNTMGANDIGFSAVAIACYMTVAEPFINGLSGGGELNLEELLSMIGEIVDAPWNPWFGVRRARDADGKPLDKFEKYDPYCHDKKNVGQAAEKAIADLPEKYAAAMKEIKQAAPDSTIVAANYPNLIPHNSQSNFPKARVLANDGSFAYLTDAFNGGTGLFFAPFPATPKFDGSMTYAQLDSNRKEWGTYWEQNLMGFISFYAFQYPLLATLNLLLEKDMNWAAWKMIPDLDDAIYKTAKSMGGRVRAVDLREVLNGREYSTFYKGTSATDDHKGFVGLSQANLAGVGHMSYTDDKIISPAIAGYGAYSSDQLRASFVTGPLAGLPFNVPVLCPGNVKMNGKEMADGTCLGEMNDPLHPNWRGQAAQGQCYVAVVTGMLGDGDACVRSIGDNESLVPPPSVDEDSFFFQVSWLNNVNAPDRLCVAAAPRDDYDWKQVLPSKPYSACSSGLLADPSWDSERWATVAEYGNWK